MMNKEEVTITFYAAECGEFHDFGEYTKCKTLEEAYKKYQKYCKTSANMCPSIEFSIHDPDSIFSVPYCVGDSDCPLLFSCSSLGFSFASRTAERTSSFGSRAAGFRICGFLSLTRSLISFIRSPSFRISYLIGQHPDVSFFPAVSATAPTV